MPFILPALAGSSKTDWPAVTYGLELHQPIDTQGFSHVKSRYSRSPLVRAAAAACLLVAPQAQAVVFYSTSSPTFNTTTPTGSLAGSGWQYEGINGSHLGTPIGPHHFLTAAHLNNGVGGTFTYNGVNYTTVASQDFGDLRLFQVSGTFYSYAPLYDAASDGDETGKGGVVIGRGRTCGAEATADGA